MSLFKGGANSPMSQQSSVYNSLRIQTSVYGIVIPVIFGVNRATGNLIWYGDFMYFPADNGGGGKGGGKGGSTDQAYYTCSFAMAICEGPIGDISTLWAGSSVFSTYTGTFQVNDEQYAAPASSPYQITVARSPFAGDLGVTMSGVDEGGVQYTNVPMVKVASDPQAGQYSVDAGTGTYTFSDEWGVASYAISYAYTALVTALAQAGLSLLPGNYTGNGWSYLSARGQEMPYPGVAYVVAQNQNIGPSGSLPNLSYEVRGLSIVPGLLDANPADIIGDIICDPRISFDLSPTLIDVDTYYRNYCLAANFLLSPVVTSQRAASDTIQEVLDSSFSTLRLHNGKTIQIVPYGDAPLTGNGATYTPDLTPVYDLGDDDFIFAEGEDPVKVSVKNTTDQKNHLDVEYLDRSNAYNVCSASWDDQGDQDLFTIKRDEPKQLHMICQGSIAQNIAQLTGQRGLYVVNTYTFTLGWKYIKLEPHDPVTLTDANLGLVRCPVRIVKIEENDQGKLDVEAEEFPEGVGYAPLYAPAAPSPFSLNRNVDPGPVNTPVIFMAPSVLTASGYEIWVALSGGANWGGCHVYASTDGSTYTLAGKVSGPSRYGILSAALASHADPDTVDTAAVDLTASKGELLSGTQGDADTGVTLCLAGNELFTYETAAFTATNKYNLTYLRRGFYNSAIAAHPQYTRFVRLDSSLLKYPFDPALMGKTIYLKFTSFNQFGASEQPLSDVTPYSFTIGASPSNPGNVTGFTAVVQGTGQVAFSWTPVGGEDITGYEIRYGAQGSATWAAGTPVVKNAATSHIVTAMIPPGKWTCMICAIDGTGNYSQTPATADVTVIFGADSFTGSNIFYHSTFTTITDLVHSGGPGGQGASLVDGGLAVTSYISGSVEYQGSAMKFLNAGKVTPSFNKGRHFRTTVRFDEAANQTIRISSGGYGSDYRAVGFVAQGNQLYGFVNNGSTETDTAALATITAGTTYLLEADFWPGISASFSINGSLVGGLTTGLPTGDMTFPVIEMNIQVARSGGTAQVSILVGEWMSVQDP